MEQSLKVKHKNIVKKPFVEIHNPKSREKC